MKKKKHKTLFQRIEPLLYLLPAIILFGLFTFYPFAKTIVYSFFNTDNIGRITTFNGLGNFKTLLTDSVFIHSLGITIIYAACIVVFSIVIGVVLALVSSEIFPGHKIFRTVYALPMAISAAAAAAIFNFIFHPTVGLLNNIFHTNIGWTIDSKYALLSVTIVTVWMNIGLNFIYSLAAIQGVSQDLYDSAIVDGAGAVQKAIHITIPGISPTLFFLLVINVIFAFQQYAQVRMITGGGPSNSTRVLVYEIFDQAFTYGRFGYACAESIVLFAIILIMTIIQFRLEGEVTYS